METDKSTLVLGASLKPERHSNMAVQRLRAAGHTVHAVGGRAGSVGDVDIVKDPEKVADEDIHTVTLYMNAQRQAQYYDFILNLKPERIIFNPGAENRELLQLAREQGIRGEEACTLVKLSLRNY